MAVVKLADVYEPLTFNSSVDEKQIELNFFINSGIMVPDEALRQQIASGGLEHDLSGYNPLGQDDPDITNDDDTDKSTPKKITSHTMKARVDKLHQSWSTMDFARELALKEPLQAIVNKVGGYWSNQEERRLIKKCLGILADNKANDSSDMVHTVGNDASGAVADAQRISAEAVLTAKQTMGDHASNLTALAIHSAVYTRLQKQQLIDYITPANSEIRIPVYLDYRLIIDDSLPAVMGANRIMYTCILFGAGSFVYAPAAQLTPSELARYPDAGNGGGQDVLHTRRSYVAHPMGFSQLSAGMAGNIATLAELETAAVWNRIWNRKHANIAFLEVND